MSQIDLLDLHLAGVEWEIQEKPIKTNLEKNGTNNTSSKQHGEPIIVPAMAPVTLETAKSMANRPTDTESLSRMLGEFNHPLKSTATNVVLPSFSEIPSNILFITDFPNTEDDIAGQILSGKIGNLFDKMLNAINLSRKTINITPLLFWNTPGNRTPTTEEITLAKPFVDRIISLLHPTIIVTLGTFACKEFTGTKLSESHDTEITMPEYENTTIFPIYHPSMMLLNTNLKRDAWETLQKIQKMLKN
ncbi:MAG: uracil-DNA glycosylase [Alphaproteobacteria bacterium]|nr:uracil-DNA glycosylase [Alphaproteobacteria bacterium]